MKFVVFEGYVSVGVRAERDRPHPWNGPGELETGKLETGKLETGNWKTGNWTAGNWKLDTPKLETGKLSLLTWHGDQQAMFVLRAGTLGTGKLKTKKLET